MPFPAVGNAMGRAAYAVGGWIAAAVVGDATREVLNREVQLVDQNNAPVTNNYVTAINGDQTVNVVAGNEDDNTISMNNDSDGAERARYRQVPSDQVTPEQRAATAESLQTIQGTPEGRAALRDGTEATRQTNDVEENSTQATQATQEQREALNRVQGGNAPLPLNNEGRAAIRRTGAADGSRTSKEEHEWRFNCVDTGKNWIMCTLVTNNKGIGYTGSDPTSPFGAPGYHKWIEHPDFRKAINRVKAVRRARGRCGGKALWEEQGFATKDDAIASDLETDTDFQDARTVLIATADFGSN